MSIKCDTHIREEHSTLSLGSGDYYYSPLTYTSLPLFLSLPASRPTSTPDYIPGVDLGRHTFNEQAEINQDYTLYGSNLPKSYQQ